MAIQLEQEIITLLGEPETVKVLATIDPDGTPHVVIKQSLQLDGAGNLIYLELLESSQTNKNLLRSIWFNRKISVTLRGKGGESYQIKGKPVQSLIAGPVFQQHYTAVRERLGDVDLAAVWVIEPEAVSNQTFRVRQAEEEKAHPYFKHLDRLAK